MSLNLFKPQGLQGVIDYIKVTCKSHLGVSQFLVGEQLEEDTTDKLYPCAFLESAIQSVVQLNSETFSVALSIGDRLPKDFANSDLINLKGKTSQILDEIHYQLGEVSSNIRISDLSKIYYENVNQDSIVVVRGEFDITIPRYTAKQSTPFNQIQFDSQGNVYEPLPNIDGLEVLLDADGNIKEEYLPTVLAETDDLVNIGSEDEPLIKIREGAVTVDKLSPEVQSLLTDSETNNYATTDDLTGIWDVLGQLSGTNPKDFIAMCNAPKEFYSPCIDQTGFLSVQQGGVAGSGYVTGRIGVLRAEASGTTGAAGFKRLASNSPASFTLTRTKMVVKALVQIPELSTEADEFLAVYGFSDSLSPVPSLEEGNYSLLVYDSGTYGSNWRALGKSQFGSVVSTDTGVTVVAGQWYVLEIHMNANSDEMRFLIDNVLVATHTFQHMETGVHLLAGIAKTSGISPRSILIDDWYEHLAPEQPLLN